MAAAGSRGVVIGAFVANFAITIAKAAAYLVSGSSAMLAEAFHSAADTFNQVLLFLGLRLQETPPDEEHPFGHGRDRFFWSFLAAVFIFFGGGVFAVYEGMHKMGETGAEHGGLALSYGVLALAFLFDGWIFRKAYGTLKVQAEARGIRLWTLIRRTKDPTTITVLFEDSAALAGVVIAAAGIALTAATGDVFWDAGASILIGVILMGVAVMLAYETRSLLLGEAATPEERREIREAIESSPFVEGVPQLLTMHLSPDEILVTGHVTLAGDVDFEEAARELRAIERRVREEVAGVQYIFLGICEPPDCPGTREQAAEEAARGHRRSA